MRLLWQILDLIFNEFIFHDLSWWSSMSEHKLVLYHICSWKRILKMFCRSPWPVHSLKILFFQRIAIIFFSLSECHLLATSFMHAFFAIKWLNLVKEEKYVIHCLEILDKNFLIQSKSENVISDKCQRRHYKQKEQNTSKAVNCMESCDSDDDYTPPNQNID